MSTADAKIRQAGCEPCSALRFEPPQARLDVAHTKQTESEGGRQQALKAVQEAWKQIDDLRADVRCTAVLYMFWDPCLLIVSVALRNVEQRPAARAWTISLGRGS